MRSRVVIEQSIEDWIARDLRPGIDRDAILSCDPQYVQIELLLDIREIMKQQSKGPEVK